ncbi:MAG: beta-lactamase family protein [Caulobacterales bacterium]|nr:beta-lactamase family protein [Caulobacterales bacterium]
MTDTPQPSRRVILAAGLAAAVPGRALAAAGDWLDAFIEAERTKAAIPGLAVGFARDGEVRLARGYGLADIARKRPVTADTMFHIASLTKTVTATVVAGLAGQGRLNLDDPVAPALDFPLSSPRFAQSPITYRQLLTHTSGISDAKYYEVDFRSRGADQALSLRDFLIGYLVPGGAHWSAADCFSDKAPGAAWDYSNVGYALLGYLAGRIGGQDMREQTRRRMFAPLGMRHTRWTIAETPARLAATGYEPVEGKLTPVEPIGAPDWPGSMLRCAVTDFTRFAAAAANGGAACGARLLDANAAAGMLAMQTPAGLPDWLTGQGLGWMEAELGGARRPNHWGGDPGVFTAAYLDPTRRSAAVILSNTTVTAEARTAVKAIAARLLSAA